MKIQSGGETIGTLRFNDATAMRTSLKKQRGRSVYGHVITNFSPMGSLPHFLTQLELCCPRFARESSANNEKKKNVTCNLRVRGAAGAL